MSLLNYKKCDTARECTICKESFFFLEEDPFIAIDTMRKKNFSPGHLTHKYDKFLAEAYGRIEIFNDFIVGYCKDCVQEKYNIPGMDVIEQIEISVQDLLMRVVFKNGAEVTVKLQTRYDDPVLSVEKNWNRVVNSLKKYKYVLNAVSGKED